MHNLVVSLLLSLCLLMVTSASIIAQDNRVHYSGTIIDSLRQNPIRGVSVQLEGSMNTTTTDARGEFNLSSSWRIPVTLIFSKPGYVSERYRWQDTTISEIEVYLQPQHFSAEDQFYYPHRRNESLLETPRTVLKIDAHDLAHSPAFNYMQTLGDARGMHTATTGMIFQSVNPGGLNQSVNRRTLHITDGMDNQIPGEYYAMGYFTGPQEIDLESIEVTDGPLSAVYGGSAMNGLVAYRSKNPFEFRGLSVSTDVGLADIGGINKDDLTPIFQIGARYAAAYKDKIAAKVSFTALTGEDWHATDISNQQIDGEKRSTRISDPGYDGVNVYGDEIFSVFPFGPQGSDEIVTRTGYNESALIDYDELNLRKFNFGLHWLVLQNLEVSFSVDTRQGNTVYVKNNRGYVEDVNIDKIKGEFRGDNYFARVYRSSIEIGRNFDAKLLGRNLNLFSKNNTSWFQDFGSVFQNPPFDENTFLTARDFADDFGRNLSGFNVPRIPAGDPIFEALKDSIIDGNAGRVQGLDVSAEFESNTSFTHAELFYDFKDLIPFVGLQLGASTRTYQLNEESTIINPTNTMEDYTEDGVYGQVYKKVLEDKLSLNFNARLDQTDFYDDEEFSYGLGASFEFLPGQFGRGTFQTGFRFPSLQELFVDKDIGAGRVMGGFLELNSLTIAQPGTPGITVSIPFNTIYLQNVRQFQRAVNAEISEGVSRNVAINNNLTILEEGILQNNDLRELEPEEIRYFNFGYRSFLTEKLFLDIDYRQSEIERYISRVSIIRPLGTLSPSADLRATATLVTDQQTRQIFHFIQNAKNDVITRGVTVGVEYKLSGGYQIGLNGQWVTIDNADNIVQVPLNVPEYTFNATISNQRVTEYAGFSLQVRWQDSFVWTSSFVSGKVDDYATVNAQLIFHLPFYNTKLRLGGRNIFNNRYRNNFGGPTIGALYYVSLSLSDLFDLRSVGL